MFQIILACIFIIDVVIVFMLLFATVELLCVAKVDDEWMIS
jgi:hypothetical protein